MKSFKHTLYNYEKNPPEEMWDKISGQLNEQKIVRMQGLRGKSKLTFYATTAAAALVIIFTGSIFFTKKSSEKKLTQNTFSQAVSSTDSIYNNESLEEIIKNSHDGKSLLASLNENNISKKYITIAGPDGTPVKISSKVATLILWADNEYPPKPVWNNKIDKWQQMMLSNISSPTSAGLMEVIQSSLSNNLE